MRYVVIDQQTADELGGDDLGGAGEEGLRKCWEILGDGLGGYGSGLVDGWRLLGGERDTRELHKGRKQISCRVLRVIANPDQCLKGMEAPMRPKMRVPKEAKTWSLATGHGMAARL